MSTKLGKSRPQSGSTSGLDPDDSHEEAKNNSGALQGSGRASEGRSQGFYTEVHDLVKRFFQDRGDSCTVAEMGGLVNDALKMLEVDCRPRSMAGSRDIFPLPVQEHFAPGKPKKNFSQQLSEDSIAFMESLAEDPVRSHLPQHVVC